MLRKIISLLLTLLLAVGFLFSLVVLRDAPPDASAHPLYPPPLSEVQGNDLDALIAVFDAELPVVSRTGEGSVRTVDLSGRHARLMTWTDQNGIVVSAVQPAACSSLLRRDHLSLIENTVWTLDGHSILIAEGAAGACAYFAAERAAYAVYLPKADRNDLFSLLNTLSLPH